MNDQSLLRTKLPKSFGERLDQGPVVHAHDLDRRTRRIGQGPEQVEDRARAEGAAYRREIRRIEAQIVWPAIIAATSSRMPPSVPAWWIAVQDVTLVRAAQPASVVMSRRDRTAATPRICLVWAYKRCWPTR